MKLALVIQCGASKREGAHPVWDLYTGPFWSTYRARRREAEGSIEGAHPDFDVFVLSAQFGLRHELDVLPWYECRLTKDQVTELASAVSDQVSRLYPRLSRRPVWFLVRKHRLQDS